MKRFIEGESREQVTLLPECLDDYIGQDNPVRVVDAFVEELDLRSLGFQGADPAATGRPAYHPSVLLKLYICGYLNRIQSSRRLEREAQRNVELMWLTGRLAPDFKTIADFRHHNSAGIRNVCKRFIGLCRDLKLFSQAIVAIDGSKFKAVNSRDANFTPGKVDARQRQIEQSIQRYLDALETADRTQPAEVEAKTERLTDKIRKLREQMRQLDETREQLKNEPDGQRSTTDPDARSMNSQAKGAGMVGYNVQTAVDAKHHLIVAHEVTNIGNDRAQLSNMAKAAREAMGTGKLQAFADRGYFNGIELKACEDAGITTCVPKPMTSGAKAAGRFDKSDFIYIAKEDEYQCPAGERAIYRCNTLEKNGNLLASILVLPRYGVDMRQLQVQSTFWWSPSQAMKHCGHVLPTISKDVQDTCLQRLTATMKFTEGVPPALVEQMITKSCVDHPERYLLAFVYGHLGEHDLLRVRTDAETSCCWPPSTSRSAWPTSDHSCSPM